MLTIGNFLYTVNLVIITQGKTLKEIEKTFTHVLEKLYRYYTNNSLKPNPTKTQINAFYLSCHGQLGKCLDDFAKCQKN